MDSKEIEILDHTLQHVPLYGTFIFFDKIKLVDNVFFESVHESYTGRQHLTIVDYLHENGFVVKRLDIDKSGQTIQLTDKGRELKESGSFISYQQKITNEELNNKLDKKRLAVNERLTCYVSVTALILCLIEVIRFFLDVWPCICHPK
ncbi:MAG: hypothetical protein JJ909_00890 [Roseivirga sp.]|uniref:hypothetical protein n=1 Tax=Roseivirga sp. TaxID=1964215 RepID=UPI001B2DFEA1|nr:hypothetical protein [Roseivirga sp.]MBO6659620.1 hypothetical protein [Roseivirga sp.]MBO6759518.1 hypothetical protein [Roseivirga sp.]MBO6907643.1 hypothetical protein [Roseivirga sp.]